MLRTYINFLNNTEQIYINNIINSNKWEWGHFSTDSNAIKFWKISNLETDPFFSQHLMKKIEEVTGDKFEIERIYMNGHTACSQGNLHTDSNREDGRTFLVYCNNNWNPEFGGATTFIMEKEIVTNYGTSGSAIYFKNNIPHFATPLSRTCNDLRVTLAFKLYKV